MPRNQPRSLKPVPLTIRLSPDWCSRDSALLRRTTHRLAPRRPALILPPVPRPPRPAVSQRWRLRRSSGFRIPRRPTWFDSLSPPANPWRPTEVRAAARGIFLPQFPRPLSWPAPARVLPSRSRQISGLGHTSSNAPGTSPSAQPRKLFSFERAHPIRAHWQTLIPPDFSAHLG